jgi:hypothetical protein
MTATFQPARGAHRVIRSARIEPADVAVPNYRARRVGAAFVALCVLAAVVVMASTAIGSLSDLGGRPAAASEVSAASPRGPAMHVAVTGDTLWSIADRYRGDVDRARYLDALIDLNGGTDILAGQAVLLP